MSLKAPQQASNSTKPQAQAEVKKEQPKDVKEAVKPQQPANNQTNQQSQKPEAKPAQNAPTANATLAKVEPKMDNKPEAHTFTQQSDSSNKDKSQGKRENKPAEKPKPSAIGKMANQQHAVGLNTEKDSAPASHAFIAHQ